MGTSNERAGRRTALSKRKKNQDGLRYGSILAAGVVTDTIVNQKGSLLGKILDISDKYRNDDDDPPTPAGGGAVGSEGGSEGGALEFAINNPLLTLIALSILAHLAYRAHEGSESSGTASPA